jgi:hypothetical protein
MLGAAFVFAKQTLNSVTSYALKYSLASPLSSGSNFGFAVGIGNNFVGVGGFSDKALLGAIVLGAVSFSSTSSSSTPDSINSITKGSGYQLNYVILALLILLGIVVAVGVLLCCNCCATPAAVIEKKKKKEEEESPYTVHSYTGYCEIDDALPVPVPFRPQPASMFSMWNTQPLDASDPMLMKKESMKKEKDGYFVEKADEGFVRRLFPFKVYGPGGFVQDQDTMEDSHEAINRKISQENESHMAPPSEFSATTTNSFHRNSDRAAELDEAFDTPLDNKSVVSSLSSGSSLVERARSRYSNYRNYLVSHPSQTINSSAISSITESVPASSNTKMNMTSSLENQERELEKLRAEAKIRAESTARERFAVFKARNEAQMHDTTDETIMSPYRATLDNRSSALTGDEVHVHEHVLASYLVQEHPQPGQEQQSLSSHYDSMPNNSLSSTSVGTTDPSVYSQRRRNRMSAESDELKR